MGASVVLASGREAKALITQSETKEPDTEGAKRDIKAGETVPSSGSGLLPPLLLL